MRFGLNLPIGGVCGDPRVLADFASLAEASGWDGVFLEDYIVYQGHQDWSACDPWIALAAMALATERIRLGTEVTPLSRRRPWKLARETVTLDHLCRGRLVLGVGLGDLADPGFAQVGEVTDARRRGERLDEALAILAGLWSGEPVSYEGAHFQVRDLQLLPRPVQSPRIPIWVGGAYPHRGPIERAARWDGAALYRDGRHLSPEEVRSLVGAIKCHRTTDSPFDVIVGGRARGNDWGLERDLIGSVDEAGATWWIEWVRPAAYETMRAGIECGPLLPPGYAISDEG